MTGRLFSLFVTIYALCFPLSGTTACLNSSLADLWSLAGGTVDVTVQEAVDRGFADEIAVIMDAKSGRNINTEILIASRPDLVIGSVDTASHVRTAALMEDIGVETILVREDSFADFQDIFRTLTEITGREDLYERYSSGQEAEIESIIRRCSARTEHPRVLFVRAGSAFSAVRAKRAADHFAAQMIQDLGAVNVADEFGALTDSLSLEALLAGDIEKILVVPQGDEEAGRAYIQSLFSRPGWRDVDAELIFLDKELFHYKPNGRWAEAYRCMEEVLYG